MPDGTRGPRQKRDCCQSWTPELVPDCGEPSAAPIAAPIAPGGQTDSASCFRDPLTAGDTEPLSQLLMATAKGRSSIDIKFRVRACGKLAGYIFHAVVPLLAVPPNSLPTTREATVLGLIHRCTLWLHSLTRLDEAGDFQAHSGAARALHELAVDMTLIARGRADVADRIVVWEESAKLKSAEGNLRLPLRRGAHVGVEERRTQKETRAMMRYWVRANRPRIVQERMKYWPQYKGKHPPRWTGGGLPEAARDADQLFNRARFMRSDVEHSARLNWAVHGSTLAGTRGGVDLAEVSQLCLELALRWTVVAVRMAIEARGVLTAERRKTIIRLRELVHLAVLEDVLHETARGQG